jgi:hypothetical protein
MGVLARWPRLPVVMAVLPNLLFQNWYSRPMRKRFFGWPKRLPRSYISCMSRLVSAPVGLPTSSRPLAAMKFR